MSETDLWQPWDITEEEVIRAKRILRKAEKLNIWTSPAWFEHAFRERNHLYGKSFREKVAKIEDDVIQKEKEDEIWLAGVEKRSQERNSKKEREIQHAHEIELKNMDLEIERERAETMDKMMEMAKSMNMDLEDLKRFLDDN